MRKGPFEPSSNQHEKGHERLDQLQDLSKEQILDELFEIQETYLNWNIDPAMTEARGRSQRVEIATREMMYQMRRMSRLVKRLGNIDDNTWNQWFQSHRGTVVPR